MLEVREFLILFQQNRPPGCSVGQWLPTPTLYSHERVHVVEAISITMPLMRPLTLYIRRRFINGISGQLPLAESVHASCYPVYKHWAA